MKSANIGLYEGFAALGLLIVVQVNVVIQADALIINPTMIKGALILMYVMVAGTSEALIASAFRPGVLWLLAINTLVALIATLPLWGGVIAVRVVTEIAAATMVLRFLVAVASMHLQRASVRRITSAAVGCPLLVATLWIAFGLGETLYDEYYLYPKFKERYAMPTRWQDFVALSVLWCGTFLLLYVSFRLLKYAIRARGVPNRA